MRATLAVEAVAELGALGHKHTFMQNTPTPEGLARLMERFGKAGWIERSIVTPSPLQIDFTSLGHTRIRQLHQILKELGRPGIDDAEFAALVGLVISFGDKNAL